MVNPDGAARAAVEQGMATITSTIDECSALLSQAERSFYRLKPTQRAALRPDLDALMKAVDEAQKAMARSGLPRTVPCVECGDPVVPASASGEHEPRCGGCERCADCGHAKREHNGEPGEIDRVFGLVHSSCDAEHRSGDGGCVCMGFESESSPVRECSDVETRP